MQVWHNVNLLLNLETSCYRELVCVVSSNLDDKSSTPHMCVQTHRPPPVVCVRQKNIGLTSKQTSFSQMTI